MILLLAVVPAVVHSVSRTWRAPLRTLPFRARSAHLRDLFWRSAVQFLGQLSAGPARKPGVVCGKPQQPHAPRDRLSSVLFLLPSGPPGSRYRRPAERKAALSWEPDNQVLAHGTQATQDRPEGKMTRFGPEPAR